MSDIWTEKYRPHTLKDIIGQRHILSRFEVLVPRIQNDDAPLPHLLLAGPPGVGKTAFAVALVRELYGEDHKILELNASDDRGIDTVREKIKHYCQTKPWNNALNIVFLDEADGLTDTAQAALRRIMEKYATTTRFILTCNHINKIMDPLRGRCTVLNFYPLKPEDIQTLVRRIAKAEGHKITKSAALLLGEFCQGDARDAINALHYLANSQDDPITDNDINGHAWRIDIQEISKLLMLCLKVKDVESIDTRLDKIDKKLGEFYEAGYTNEQLVNGMYLAIRGLKVKPRLKAQLFNKTGDLDYKLTIGCHSTIQVRAFFYGLFYTRVKK